MESCSEVDRCVHAAAVADAHIVRRPGIPRAGPRQQLLQGEGGRVADKAWRLGGQGGARRLRCDTKREVWGVSVAAFGGAVGNGEAGGAADQRGAAVAVGAGAALGGAADHGGGAKRVGRRASSLG